MVANVHFQSFPMVEKITSYMLMLCSDKCELTVFTFSAFETDLIFFETALKLRWD